MQRLLIPGSMALLAACASAGQQEMSPNTLTAEEREMGFELLFDGESLEHWRGYQEQEVPASWAAVDGELRRVAGGGDLVSREQFDDFELRLEWKISPGGNSGIMYRVTEDGEATFTSGPEMQVLDDEAHRDGGSRLTSAGSNYGLNAAPEGVVRPAGEWNEVRIVVDSAHVEHWLNGQKVVEYELWSDEWNRKVAATKFAEWPEYGMARSGHIALQDHGDEVVYRSIRIRRLP